jgi:hypothetical protein
MGPGRVSKNAVYGKVSWFLNIGHFLSDPSGFELKRPMDQPITA